MSVASKIRSVLRFKSTLVIILVPLLCLPVPILYESKAGRCAYGLLIMALYWMTEALPIAATALLPIALFPWLGVIPSKQLCQNYFKDTNVLFLGGLMIAVAIERWNLHKRIALRVLLLVGSEPRWLMFGFMLTTAFLSMWISNTATTAMMIPIVHAVLLELEQNRENTGNNDTVPLEKRRESKNRDDEIASTSHRTDATSDDNSMPPPAYNIVVSEEPTHDISINSDNRADSDNSFKKMSKGMMLSICYAANIGGSSTLTGTGPNLVLKGQVDTLFDGNSGITFSSWFVFAFPNMVISLALAWLWLQTIFLGPRELCRCFFKNKGKVDNTASKVIAEEYRKLGPMSFAEKAVLVHFVLLAVLWLTRNPEFVPGWEYFLPDGYVTDASVSITIAVFLFICPSRRPNYWCFRRKTDTEEPGPAPGLLDWDIVHRKLAWSAILVLGGGFALADACKESGLSSDISQMFRTFAGVPPWLLVMALCGITATFTEVTSNVATATIFLPILAELATSIHIHPLYLMMPTCVSTSFAFMLPVATPPNALVFAYGHLRIMDMVKTGIIMNIMCILILQLSINTWGYAYFDLGTFPWWAGNDTTTAATVWNITTLTPNSSDVFLNVTTSAP